MGLGEANIAARFGSLTSQPAKVKVVEAIADPLRTDPKTIRLRVGEEAQLGDDVAVFRGDADVSQLCKMTSSAARVRPLPARDEEPGRRLAGHVASCVRLGRQVVQHDG